MLNNVIERKVSMLLKKEILCTNSFEKFNQVKSILVRNNIPYTYKVWDQTDSGFMDNHRRSTGSFGVNMNVTKYYYLYVSTINYDKASFLLQN